MKLQIHMEATHLKTAPALNTMFTFSHRCGTDYVQRNYQQADAHAYFMHENKRAELLRLPHVAP